MSTPDIRWKQRFSNFNKVLSLLESGLALENPDLMQKAGVIQFFELSFELAWKMIKDYMENQGFQDVKSPRSAIKKAFETNLIQQGHEWMQLLEDRNLLSHTYDENKSSELYILIKRNYFPLLKDLQVTFIRMKDEN